MTPRDDPLLRLPEGGSLNALDFRANVVVKSYAGAIERGYEKLWLEYSFLRDLPPQAARHFARPVLFLERHDPRRTELHLRRHREPAVAKAILRGLLPEARTRAIVAEALRVLLDDLYPLRSRTSSGRALYERFHRRRLASAVPALGELPGLAPLVHATDLRVNGLPCPSTAQTLRWLDAHAARYFRRARLVAAHGDTHLDNILAPTAGPVAVRLVDPRGERLMPPHYDFAKLAKAVRTGYDLVHYGGYQLALRTDEHTLHVDLAVDHAYDHHYRGGLEVLLGAVAAYADAERVTQPEFLRAAALAEVAHVVSFAWYHANHARGCDTNRVVAYLATAALLARAVMERDPASVPDLTRPLPL
jgi:hypothetical protein